MPVEHLLALGRRHRAPPQVLGRGPGLEAPVHGQVDAPDRLLKVDEQRRLVAGPRRAHVLLRELLERVRRAVAVEGVVLPGQDEEERGALVEHAVPLQQRAERVLEVLQDVGREDGVVGAAFHGRREVARVADERAADRRAAVRGEVAAVDELEAPVRRVRELGQVVAGCHELVDVRELRRRAADLQRAPPGECGDDGVAVLELAPGLPGEEILAQVLERRREARVEADVAQRRARDARGDEEQGPEPHQ